MSMYFVGIVFFKYKHDCYILSAVDQNNVTKFTIKNDKSGFEQLIKTLHSLSIPENIKIGFESTAHYVLNLELFLENAHHSFMESKRQILMWSVIKLPQPFASWSNSL